MAVLRSGLSKPPVRIFPRRWRVYCAGAGADELPYDRFLRELRGSDSSQGCGWSGARTGDTAEEACAKRCPKCGAAVRGPANPRRQS